MRRRRLQKTEMHLKQKKFTLKLLWSGGIWSGLLGLNIVTKLNIKLASMFEIIGSSLESCRAALSG